MGSTQLGFALIGPAQPSPNSNPGLRGTDHREHLQSLTIIPPRTSTITRWPCRLTRVISFLHYKPSRPSSPLSCESSRLSKEASDHGRAHLHHLHQPPPQDHLSLENLWNPPLAAQIPSKASSSEPFRWPPCARHPAGAPPIAAGRLSISSGGPAADRQPSGVHPASAVEPCSKPGAGVPAAARAVPAGAGDTGAATGRAATASRARFCSSGTAGGDSAAGSGCWGATGDCHLANCWLLINFLKG